MLDFHLFAKKKDNEEIKQAQDVKSATQENSNVSAPAFNNEFNNEASSYDKLILRVLPETIDFQSNDLYSRLINICHYISLLSDRNAILLYKNIKGLSIN